MKITQNKQIQGQVKKLEYFYDNNDRINISNEVKNIGGVYVLFDNNLNVLYIGETKNFRLRLSSHISKNNNSRQVTPSHGDYRYSSSIPLNIITHYILIESEDKLEREMIESFLVKYLFPKFNRICISYKNDEDEV